ncbi:Glycosyltransferase involved in cell wall bisynthesis [Marinobacter persicus]|uniref:Glycosyltransferase involved in cell wall bisynthesis n=1 Tax=Marinobacter persicus TaxID=930118 RepID=A0A1I3PET7_9GAMM|nr:glycosyltransferase family 2 protein [Marinobacter persicus]GHD53878.1 glycosyl transferase [Marinobacter persicus]SFJ19849.1 Glycosyltransferase involved in cell wall bisynthesis [Marinobacter persicus]
MADHLLEDTAMTSSGYSTTRRLTTDRPSCFGPESGALSALLKTPDSEQKVAEGGLRLQGFYKVSQNEKPLITVITVVYNGAEFIEQTILSVIEQSYDNVEYIVIDGGSKDSTQDIIKRYEHAIDYWVSEPDSGIYSAMNKGIALASGEWLNFMNSGDRFFTKNSLSEIPFDDLNDYEFIYGDKFQNNEVVKSFPLEILRSGVIHACHQSMFFRKNIETLDMLRYDERYRIYSDYDLVARFYRNECKFFYHRSPVSVFQGGGISSDVSSQKRKDKYLSVYSNFGVVGIFRALSYRIIAYRLLAKTDRDSKDGS